MPKANRHNHSAKVRQTFVSINGKFPFLRKEKLFLQHHEIKPAGISVFD